MPPNGTYTSYTALDNFFSFYYNGNLTQGPIHLASALLLSYNPIWEENFLLMILGTEPRILCIYSITDIYYIPTLLSCLR